MAATTTYLYRVASCCDTRDTATFQSVVNFLTGTYTYSGSTYIDPINGFEWVSGQCYQIVKIGTGLLPSGVILPDADLTINVGDCLTAPCPCASDNRYLIFEKCCDGSLIYFKSTQDGGYLVGLKEYNGVPTYLLENVCYRVDTVSVGIGPIVNNTMWNALPLAPNAINYTGPTNFTIKCDDPGFLKECPVCVEKCFLLTTCDGDIIYTNTNLTLYLGQFININDQDNEPILGDWYVIQTDAPCDPESFFSSIQVTASNLQPDCPNECYEVTGTPTIILYVDEDQVTQEILGASKFCSIVPPIVMGGTGEVTNYGPCVNNECVDLCYLFTNCLTSETLTVVSNTSNISQYASQNKVVTLNGYDGCWTIELSEDCECPVNVTILQVFDDCPSCLPIIAYKFTNCNNQTIVRYSLDDYSAYVGKTVELDCGECWFVTEIDYMPPATQPIVILYTFDSCIACNRTYYKLTDCLDPTNVTYTYTDLSSVIPTPIGCDCISVTYQVLGEEPITIVVDNRSGDFTFSLYPPPPLGAATNGWIVFIDTVWIVSTGALAPSGIAQATLYENIACPLGTYTIEEDSIFESFVVEPCSSLPVIKIKGCDSCFTVEETREPINAGIVELVDSFIDCPECLETFPCVCNRITNQDTIAKDFIYLDCSFEEVTINLQPNETSDKICLINWVLTPEEEALVYIEHFGNCNGGNLCYNYAITIGSDTTAALYYKNCSGDVESQQTLSQRSPYTITICGINNQTSSDIYIVGSGSMSFEKTTTCATQPFTCPAEPLPKRKVKPGYSTPSCDIEKYEKITCKASEIYYKQVLRLRYGISNCCPEDEEKWLVKKELIDLDALRDPDYICTPVTTCCNQPISSCGCGCNQTLKTCNS